MGQPTMPEMGVMRRLLYLGIESLTARCTNGNGMDVFGLQPSTDLGKLTKGASSAHTHTPAHTHI